MYVNIHPSIYWCKRFSNGTFFSLLAKVYLKSSYVNLKLVCMNMLVARATSCMQIWSHLSTPDRWAPCQTHLMSLPLSSPQGSHQLVVRQLHGEKGGSAHAVFSHFRDHSFCRIQNNIDLCVDIGRHTDVQFCNYRTSLWSSVSQFLIGTSQSTQKILPSLVTPVIYSCMFAHSLFKHLNSKHMTNEFSSNLCGILV